MVVLQTGNFKKEYKMKTVRVPIAVILHNDGVMETKVFLGFSKKFAKESVKDDVLHGGALLYSSSYVFSDKESSTSSEKLASTMAALIAMDEVTERCDIREVFSAVFAQGVVAGIDIARNKG